MVMLARWRSARRTAARVRAVPPARVARVRTGAAGRVPLIWVLHNPYGEDHLHQAGPKI
jgi:hypothetical protein